MLKVGICGGSGYTGSELVRILLSHPGVRITVITSERSQGRRVSSLFPHFTGLTGLSYESLIPEKIIKKADFFFMALPHAASQEAVSFFYKSGKHVCDLSADYRLKDPRVYETWYGVRHEHRTALKRSVYGLPELYRSRIRRARLVANPGCFPTGAILGIYPLAKKGLVDPDSFVVDSKSGTAGAGRKADTSLSFCEVNESFRAYAIATHRHTPEIEQEVSRVAGRPVRVDFTPHLLPVNRGILTTVYSRLTGKYTTEELLILYRKTFGKEPFVRVLDEGRFPDIRNVRGSNFCDVGLKVNERTGTVIVVTAIDNLVKGASGQAVQNMNIMMGFEETSGLSHTPALP